MKDSARIVKGQIPEATRQAIAAVSRLGDKAGEIFTEFDRDRIMASACEAEERVASSVNPLPLAGIRVSVKDLYDEAGVVTTAASRLLKDRPAAIEDAEVIARVKRAGAVPFGRTVLSEFAFTGVGLNPHYGSLGCVFDEHLIPGGSTSGGALTVALGLSDAALGTDTGGSIRIPAAVNGLVGFKPSRSAVPMSGVHPLAEDFDTAGPLSRDLATAVSIFEVISGQPRPSGFAVADRPLKLAVPRNAFVDGLDETQAATFDRVLAALDSAGHRLIEVDFAFLMDNAGLNRLLVAAAAWKFYGDDIEQLERVGDPRVLSRIRAGRKFASSDVAKARAQRQAVIRQFDQRLDGFDALVAPTLAIAVPTIAEAEADFDRVNAGMLRNTSLLNLADACAIALPVARSGQAPGSLMLGAPSGKDWSLLQAAHAIAPLLAGLT